ncbi:MAG: 4Fe-4S binding protein [Methanomicrobiales archaeon]|nr:4Fe-4S binding protein [Methanomicrobiales archaeon]
MTEENKNRTSSSRQKFRLVLLILSFLLIPVTIFFISPIILMMGAAEGIITGSMIFYILLFFIALFAGRIWCGWLCPMGAWQEFWSPVIKRPVAAGWRDLVKYGITVLMLITIVASFIAAGRIKGIDFFYGTVGGISVSSLDVLQIVVMIFISILVIAFIFGKRGFCHVICPIAGIMIIGRVIADRAGWSALRLSVQNDTCTGCRTCQKECPMGLAVPEMVRNNQMENPDCILCARCADTCPEGVIGYSIRRK